MAQIDSSKAPSAPTRGDRTPVPRQGVSKPGPRWPQAQSRT